MPERIQRSRAKGWRMPPNTVYVGRPTKWGNPFIVGQPNPQIPTRIVEDRRHATILFRASLLANPALAAVVKEELAGKNLACWCPPSPPYEQECHADVLLEVANGTSPE